MKNLFKFISPQSSFETLKNSNGGELRKEERLGQIVALSEVTNTYRVKWNATTWSASSELPIEVGNFVFIEKRLGNTLTVTPI